MSSNNQNETLDKAHKEIIKRLKRFQYLSNIRNIDFPMNHISIVENNLIMINKYYQERILIDTKYSPKLDMWLVTLIVNYLTSVKAYLNRKIKKVEKQSLIKIDKEHILSIIKNNRKKDRNETSLDRLVKIRDKFEHEEINDISLTLTFHKDKTQKTLMYQDMDLLQLFNDSFRMLKEMNHEISSYIEESLTSLDLRHCASFMNAFHRKYKENQYTELFPEETDEEIKKYDDMICNLSK
ncbi:MAG: hypothetical protein RG740_04080 [Acholeplasmataceae bacterium]|nr:hypothetical protein [Acholeplasmataceae bacterium]